MPEPYRNALDRATAVADRLLRQHAAGIRPDYRTELAVLARDLVLDAAAVCLAMGDSKVASPEARETAGVCAVAIMSRLLCREGEAPCPCCHGYGCTRCDTTGVVRPKGAES